MAVPSPVGDVNIASPISTLVLNTLTLKLSAFFFSLMFLLFLLIAFLLLLILLLLLLLLYHFVRKHFNKDALILISSFVGHRLPNGDGKEKDE